MNRDLYTPPGGPPEVERPDARIFAAMGDDGIRRMIHDFYGHLATSSISPLFQGDMSMSADRSADYFVQLLGGPALFQQKYGPPRLRARHIPFTITETDRQVWLSCFAKTLASAPETFNFPEEHMPGFQHFLDEFSAWMVNSDS